MRELLPRTTSISLHLALACLMLAVAPASARAQNSILAPNATFSGDPKKFGALISTVMTTPCANSQCRFRMRPVTVTVSVPGQATMEVTLDTIQDPRNVVREEDDTDPDELHFRPLLLRGHTKIRHAGPNGEQLTLPIAAAIHREHTPHTLELMVPRRSRYLSNTRGFAIVRTILGSHTPYHQQNARAQAPSSFAYRRYSCASFNPGSQGGVGERAGVRTLASPITYNVLYVSTDYDEQYAIATRCTSSTACKNKILSLINKAALIFERQFGLTIEVAKQYGPTRYNNSRDSFALLSAFSTSNDRSRGGDIHDGLNQGSALVDIRQLFTGRSLNDDVIGLAFLEVACLNETSTSSDMLVQRVADSFDPVVTAHELGHTLSATHTNSGIMTAALGYPLPTQFNAESVTQIATYLQDTYGECRGGRSFGASQLQTLRLLVRKEGRSSYAFQARVSQVQEGCRVKIRAASSSGNAPSGVIVSQFTPSETITRMTAIIDASIAAASVTDSYVYLYADYVCASGETLEVSKVTRLSPNSGIRSPRRVTRPQWIKLLKSAL